MIKVQQGNLVLLFSEYKKDRVEQVNKLGNHVEVVEGDNLHVPLTALRQRRKGGVEHARKGFSVVDYESNEDVGVEDGHGYVVEEECPLQSVRFSGAH